MSRLCPKGRRKAAETYYKGGEAEGRNGLTGELRRIYPPHVTPLGTQSGFAISGEIYRGEEADPKRYSKAVSLLAAWLVTSG